ncbi:MULTISPECIES: ATP-binding protein [Bacillus]|uniref:ATP-binding protein n=1 Tax=Bacillus TaxID=1386 RepID=UPI000FDC5D11|nr:ATP-binding protein [Bacillus pumilus]AZV53549.1 histidine kinase [Bacillus pumilus]MBU5259120.1 histidine kinase [Bacillus pumilus]
MRKFYSKLTVILVILSFIYVIYISYINVFNIFVGAAVKVNSHGQLEVVDVDNFTDSYLAGVRKGDIILEVNGNEKPVEEVRRGFLANVKSLVVDRHGDKISLENVRLLSQENLFIYLIPVILYSISLFCIFMILKFNKANKKTSAYILALFLLAVSIGYVSSGGSGKGEAISRVLVIATMNSVPPLYMHFMYQYLKELGTKIIRRRVLFSLYLVPVTNILLDLFYKNKEEPINLLAYVNLLSFFILCFISIIITIIAAKKLKDNAVSNVLRAFALILISSFSPFMLFFIIPYFFGIYFISPYVVASFVLLIPFFLVYQFMSNKLYNVDFFMGRIKYYGLLAITPTILVVIIFDFIQKPTANFYTVKFTIITYILMLTVFYFKEIIDFRFRLKRFSEKHNYQDSVFKFTQLIREASSLHQVLYHLKYTILEVLVVNKAFVLEVKPDGQIEEIDESSGDSNLWKEYVDQFQDILGEVGKIIELDKGFMMKIGERGGHSFMICCLSNLQTPKLTRDEISWLKTLAFYTSVSLENVVKIEELMEHLEDLKQREANPAWLKKVMFAMEEKQRSDLARDLHDSVLQDLISLKRQSEMFLTNFQNDQCPTSIEQSLISWNEQMSKVIQTTRETCHELRPQLLYDLGLVKAMSKLTSQIQEEAPFHIRLNTTRFDKELDIDIDSQLNIYRIVQELLSNALKHSQASQVLVMLICIKDQVVLHYEDDGVGFDASHLDQHTMSMGLSGIRERVKALNGKLHIHTAPEKGLKVKIEMEL